MLTFNNTEDRLCQCALVNKQAIYNTWRI